MNAVVFQQAKAAPVEEFVTDDPAFGIWRDREDMADVAAYVNQLRQPRYARDGSRNEFAATAPRVQPPFPASTL
jgi:cytochrome c